MDDCALCRCRRLLARTREQRDTLIRHLEMIHTTAQNEPDAAEAASKACDIADYALKHFGREANPVHHSPPAD